MHFHMEKKLFAYPLILPHQFLAVHCFVELSEKEVLANFFLLLLKCGSVINIYFWIRLWRSHSGSGCLFAKKSGRCGLRGFHHHIPPSICFGQIIGFYGRIFQIFTSHFIFNHGFEISFQSSNTFLIVNIDWSILLGNDVAEVLLIREVSDLNRKWPYRDQPHVHCVGVWATCELCTPHNKL